MLLLGSVLDFLCEVTLITLLSSILKFFGNVPFLDCIKASLRSSAVSSVPPTLIVVEPDVGLLVSLSIKFVSAASEFDFPFDCEETEVEDLDLDLDWLD